MSDGHEQIARAVRAPGCASPADGAGRSPSTASKCRRWPGVAVGQRPMCRYLSSARRTASPGRSPPSASRRRCCTLSAASRVPWSASNCAPQSRCRHSSVTDHLRDLTVRILRYQVRLCRGLRDLLQIVSPLMLFVQLIDMARQRNLIAKGTQCRERGHITWRKRSHSGADASPATSASALSKSALAFAVLPMPAHSNRYQLTKRWSKCRPLCVRRITSRPALCADMKSCHGHNRSCGHVRPANEAVG